MPIADVDAAAFDAAASGAVPLIVDFWAPWCGPCKALLPSLEALADEYSDMAQFVKVDIDAMPDLAARFAVRGVPTVLKILEGNEVARLTGMTSRTRLAALIEAQSA